VLDQVATQVRLRRRPVRLEVECAVEEAALDSALTGVAQKVNRKPRNAQVQVSDEDEVTVTPEVNGLTLDVPKSKAAMLAALKTPEATEVALTVTEEKPEVTKADLADLETVLSSYSTEFNSGQEDRTHNLTLAARALDRTVIKPGDTFSLNGIVGERTPQRGYRKAPIFGVGGTLIDDYGGGVCQVASTTYNAALLANIAIVERSCHIRTVKYVPLGRDAMVSYGSIDLKWRNSLPHAVLLVARVEGESLTVKLIGKRTDRCEVRIERSGVGVVEHGKKEVPDPKLEEGKREVEKPGWDGGRASVQRLVKVGDRWESNLSYSDYYPPQDDIVRVGKKKKPKPETTPSVPTTPGEEPSPDAGTAKDRDTVAPKGREAAAPQPDPATPKDRGPAAPRPRKPPRPKPARPNVPRVP
jgi:vancomycin resistance protein YoaR